MRIRYFLRDESGQAMIGFLMVLSILLVGAAGFGVDAVNLWFQKQHATTAARSACQAAAMDMMTAQDNNTESPGFQPGIAGDCSGDSGASLCQYAAMNGYNGQGLNSTGGNDVSWTFPSPGSYPSIHTTGANQLLTVSVAQNVRLHLLALIPGIGVSKQVTGTCTCGLATGAATAASTVLPVVLLSPTGYSITGTREDIPTIDGCDITGGTDTEDTMTIYGVIGQTSLYINSSANPALEPLTVESKDEPVCKMEAISTTDTGASLDTNGNVEVVGGAGTSSLYTTTTGAPPIADPYLSVPPPSGMKNVAPASGTSGVWVSYHQDGCPDSRVTHSVATEQCIEFAPGYYPNGLTFDNLSTAIFLPGVYYFGGSVTADGEILRNATPCTPSCGPITSSTSQTSDGVMFYFSSGGLSMTDVETTPYADESSTFGDSGIPGVDEATLQLSECPGALNLLSFAPAGSPTVTFAGSALWAQCTTNGSYVDAAGDTTDSLNSDGNGTRGLLVYTDRSDTNAFMLTASSVFGHEYWGTIYVPTGQVESMPIYANNASPWPTSNMVLGDIVADSVSLDQASMYVYLLNPSSATGSSKIAAF